MSAVAVAALLEEALGLPLRVLLRGDVAVDGPVGLPRTDHVVGLAARAEDRAEAAGLRGGRHLRERERAPREVGTSKGITCNN